MALCIRSEDAHVICRNNIYCQGGGEQIMELNSRTAMVYTAKAIYGQ
jgi:hypothetical protein